MILTQSQLEYGSMEDLLEQLTDSNSSIASNIVLQFTKFLEKFYLKIFTVKMFWRKIFARHY